jgi:hypothetical protein
MIDTKSAIAQLASTGHGFAGGAAARTKSMAAAGRAMKAMIAPE